MVFTRKRVHAVSLELLQAHSGAPSARIARPAAAGFSSGGRIHHRMEIGMTNRRLGLFASGLLIAMLPLAAAVAQTTTLKASHQFPGGKGDVRDEMVQMIARDVAAANVGLEIKVYPGSSLVKAQEQWKAMQTGQIDMTSFPLDYASGFHPQFGATLMPGLVKNHDHAQRVNASPFMQEIKSIIEQGGAHVLADAWLAGAFGSKDKCIRKPEDAAGLKVRSAGSTFAQMWAGAGASIVSIPSNEVYNALQQGVAQATDTSSGSFVSFRLYEQVKCLTAPGDNALWFMYEPVLVSKRSWDKLNDAQKKALTTASKKAEAYFNTESKKLDDEMVEIFKKNKVEVVTLNAAEADAWRAVAQKTSYKAFAEKVPGGKELIEKALSVK
jgi:TRAP-type transport system periplasmic protein